jgi:hypothetical protein
MAKIVKDTDTKRIRCEECNSTIEFGVLDVRFDKGTNKFKVLCPLKTCRNSVHIPDKIIPERWKGAIQTTWL